MQIVINLGDKLYNRIKCLEPRANSMLDELMRSVQNGTPLPKGHGRLIDADELHGDFIDGTEGYDCQTWNRIEIGDIIDDAQTIIEADEVEE